MTTDTDFVYDFYGLKREQVYVRSKDDIENEKRAVSANKFLSASFLKRHSKEHRVNKVENEIKIEKKKQQRHRYDDDDDEKKLTYCYLCSIGAHVHEKTKPVPLAKVKFFFFFFFF